MRTSAQKSFSLLLVFAVALLLALPTGAGSALAAGTGTITINPPSDTGAGDSTEYSIYRVFGASSSDAGAPSYTLVGGKSDVPDVAAQVGSSYDAARDAHFVLDAEGRVHFGTESDTRTSGSTALSIVRGGSAETVYFTAVDKLTDAAVSAVAAYVDGDDPAYTLTAKGTDPVRQSGVPYGYYYVTSQMGSVVSIASSSPNATIDDKNGVPSLTKVISAVEDNAGSITAEGRAALAQVGKKISYTATVVFSKGSENIVFHDVMEAGLTYNDDASARIARVSASGESTDITDTLSSPYEVKGTPDKGDTITIGFADGLDQYAGTGGYVQAVISYSATLNSDRLSVDPLKNTAKLGYGDPFRYTQEVHTYVYSGTILVTKVDANGDALAGAGFKLTRVADGATQYYKRSSTGSGDDASVAVTWVEDADQATELTTTGKKGGNVVAFSGLSDGEYTIVESTVPAGYEKAAERTVSIAGLNGGTYDAATAPGESLHKANDTIENLNKKLTITNEKAPGSSSDSGSGSGAGAGHGNPNTADPMTVLVYLVAVALVVAAIVGLIARRRKRQS